MLLLYAIWSLQGYPRELVQNLGMDVAIDDVLMILDEHYNNVKVMDTLNQELFQLQMADTETVSDWRAHLSRHLKVLATSFPNWFPHNRVAELKWDHFYGRLPQWLKALVAYLKAGPHERTYSDYLQATREAEKEESMKSSQNPWTQVVDNAAKPKTTSFFPLQKLKGNQQVPKMAAMHLAHLEEEMAKRDEEVESEDLDSINGVTEEFMVCLTRGMKDAHQKEKCCYHCSCPEHFICNCLLVRALRDNA